jgi:hypothetical protein
MAAHVAALSGVLAAAAAASQAAEAKIPGTPSSASAGAGDAATAGSNDGADRIGDLLRVSGGGCGCAPCWGPPAPPAMRPELLDAFADLGGEEAAS